MLPGAHRPAHRRSSWLQPLARIGRASDGYDSDDVLAILDQVDRVRPFGPALLAIRWGTTMVSVALAGQAFAKADWWVVAWCMVIIAYTSFRNGVLGVYRIRPGSAQTGDSLLTSSHLAYSGIWLRDESALVTVGQALRPESNLDIAIVRNGGRDLLFRLGQLPLHVDDQLVQHLLGVFGPGDQVVDVRPHQGGQTVKDPHCLLLPVGRQRAEM